MIIIGRAKEETVADWQSIVANYKKFVKPHHVTLEIGASSIGKTLFLSKFCKKVIGVELFKDRTPKDQSRIEYINGDWQKLSQIIKPESIDIAISTHVLEHVSDDLKAIDELYKVLKAGGIALINTPNRKRLTRTIIEIFTGEKIFPYLPHEHMREYIEADLKRLIESSKFKKYKIFPVALGLQSGQYHCYLKKFPNFLRRFANVWEIHLVK